MESKSKIDQVRNCITSIFLLFISLSVSAQSMRPDSAFVIISGDTLFMIKEDGSGIYPEERAMIITDRINRLLIDRVFYPDSMTLEQGADQINILHRNHLLITTSAMESSEMGMPALELAQYRMDRMTEYLERGSYLNRIWDIVKNIALTLLVILVLYMLVKGINKLFTYLFGKIQIIGEGKLNGIKFRNYEFLSPEREMRLIGQALNLVKWILVVFFVYVSLPIVFSIFPDTQHIAETLFGYIWNPFKRILAGIWKFIPDLITIIVILIITRYIVRFMKFLSEEVQSEKLVIPGFFPDFARPTFNIARFLIYAFALVIIFPYLPGSNSPVFQGVSVFLGLLVSLGSSSAISNLIAGLFLTYMRAYKKGDRVKIGETVGDVLEKTALVTRVRTVKNETITIPNSAILSGHTINYSTDSKHQQLILHTSVTIGYDVPWRKVHELLIDAALKADNVLKDPKPFVLQISLNDFYVTYEINAYTDKPANSSITYARIHENIQDNFNESNIEILSPHFRVNRNTQSDNSNKGN